MVTQDAASIRTWRNGIESVLSKKNSRAHDVMSVDILVSFKASICWTYRGDRFDNSS